MFWIALVLVPLVALVSVLPYLTIPCALGAWINVARLRRTPEHQPALRAKPGESPEEALRVLQWAYRLYGCVLLFTLLTWLVTRLVPGGTFSGVSAWLTLPVAAVPAPLALLWVWLYRLSLLLSAGLAHAIYWRLGYGAGGRPNYAFAHLFWPFGVAEYLALGREIRVGRSL